MQSSAIEDRYLLVQRNDEVDPGCSIAAKRVIRRGRSADRIALRKECGKPQQRNRPSDNQRPLKHRCTAPVMHDHGGTR